MRNCSRKAVHSGFTLAAAAGGCEPAVTSASPLAAALTRYKLRRARSGAGEEGVRT
ncbi:unnamed protein product, partial [Gulo gulo]